MSVLDKMVVTEQRDEHFPPTSTVSSTSSTAGTFRDNANTLSSVLDGYVPGVWSWTQSPASVARRLQAFAARAHLG